MIMNRSLSKKKPETSFGQPDLHFTLPDLGQRAETAWACAGNRFASYAGDGSRHRWNRTQVDLIYLLYSVFDVGK